MNKFLTRTSIILTAVITAFFSLSASTQTLSLNDGSVLRSKTNRIGLNIGSVDFYDNGQILKNLIGSSNPSFEPLTNRQIWALALPGTTTTFSVPNIYDGVPVNYWAGATFTVVESQSGGAELGCTGLIASNTGPNYPVATAIDISPIITVATPCAAPFSIGDIVTITKITFPTPESWWENGGYGGISGGVKGGAQLLSDTTDLCDSCGVQALNMNATASGSSAVANYWYDGSHNVDTFVLMNGTYQLSFWAKAATGKPTLLISALRLSNGGFNCGTYRPQLTGTWTEYTFSCAASENLATLTPGTAQVEFVTTGGSVYLDNISFAKTSSSINNPTVLRDEAIEALQSYYGNTSDGPRGIFRDWLGQNGETVDNWTKPDYAHGPTASGGGYFIGPGGAGAVGLSLEDYLAICQYLNGDPYLEVPVTISTTEAANLIEFLAGPPSSPYGARRAALGQANPWTDVFDTIHLAFCNECWNGFSFAGQSLPDRFSQPNNEYYYDYSTRARDIFAAMREQPYYDPSSFDLVMGAQTATRYTMDIAIQRAHPDSIELEDYTYATVNSFSKDADLWGPAMVEPFEKVTNPTDPKNFYQSVTDYQSQSTCGPSGTAPCKVNIYEWGQGTINGTIDQKHLDYINAGAGEGVIMALQPLMNLQYFGILPQAFFSFTEYQNSSGNGNLAKLWGNVVDLGGATNNVRPTFLGVSLVNQSIIGPMFSCPIDNNLARDFPATPNGNGSAIMPALSNVPYLYAFCFENGKQRSLVLINTDLMHKHTISFAGSNTPTGSVTQRQYAPSSLDLMNEAPTGQSSQNAPELVSIGTSSLSNPPSITLPPYSVTALDYTATAAPVASPPLFTPAPGTYTTPQAISITSTPGATIYYTTNASTPAAASSKVYTGPVTVGANTTLRAMAVESGFTNSVVSSASYIMAPVLATPTFSVPAGTYTTARSVAISDENSGATIYYTTNGTTPTTSSTKYNDAITVNTNETLKAIAVEAGFTNSAVASSGYTIAPVLPTPVFTAAAGTYAESQSVTISDSASGTTIYYAINHTPTTSSTVYTRPITVSSTETLEAMAVGAGFTNSPVATAAYTISGSTAYINNASGGFNATSLFLNNGASVTGGLIQLTDGGAGEARSAWFSTKMPVQNFTTDFTFQQLNATADGMTFTIQGRGSTAVGSNGAGLGYEGITNSVAIKFDLYSNAGEGNNSTGLYINGTIPTLNAVDMTSTGINLHSGDIMDAHMVYDGTNLTLTITDTVTNAAVTKVFPVNIASLVGGNTAYVGFTGGTGGKTATQNVLSWTYVSSATQTVAAPVFSIVAGTYTTAQSVTISEATAGASIYYTTNGTTPTTSSTKYSGPITVGANATLEAMAVGAGFTNSPVATAAYTISGSTAYINNASGGFNATSLFLNNGASVTGGLIQLTDGGAGEARSAWFSTKMPVQNFTTDFTFQQLNATADGMTFTIQGRGSTAVGSNGAGLGYEGITNSVAIKFDLYSNAGEGNNSTGLYINGTIPTLNAVDMTSTGINLHSGDIMDAHMVYDGTNLTLTITDTVTNAAVTKVFPVNIASLVGGNTAYVGFTGGTGGKTATQNVLSWTYVVP